MFSSPPAWLINRLDWEGWEPSAAAVSVGRSHSQIRWRSLGVETPVSHQSVISSSFPVLGGLCVIIVIYFCFLFFFLFLKFYFVKSSVLLVWHFVNGWFSPDPEKSIQTCSPAVLVIYDNFYTSLWCKYLYDSIQTQTSNLTYHKSLGANMSRIVLYSSNSGIKHN